jgi:hypothetical protein
MRNPPFFPRKLWVQTYGSQSVGWMLPEAWRLSLATRVGRAWVEIYNTEGTQWSAKMDFRSFRPHCWNPIAHLSYKSASRQLPKSVSRRIYFREHDTSKRISTQLKYAELWIKVLCLWHLPVFFSNCIWAAKLNMRNPPSFQENFGFKLMEVSPLDECCLRPKDWVLLQGWGGRG